QGPHLNPAEQRRLPLARLLEATDHDNRAKNANVPGRGAPRLVATKRRKQEKLRPHEKRDNRLQREHEIKQEIHAARHEGRSFMIEIIFPLIFVHIHLLAEEFSYTSKHMLPRQDTMRLF